MKYVRVRKLRASIDAEIRHYMRCRKLLHRVDAEILTLGGESLGSNENFALWLCTPSVGLGDKAPLDVMKTAAGRHRVMNILNAIKHGIFL